jgi:membrane-associated phospholipid phosphatase
MALRTLSILLALTCVSSLVSGALADPVATGEVHSAVTGSAIPSSSYPPLFGRRDLWFAAAMLGLGAASAHNDVWITSEAIESPGGGEQQLANAVQPFGNTGLVLPALLLAYGGARFTGHRELASSVARAGVSIGAAGAVTLMLKEAVGRSRPTEAPADADVFHPFSGHASFPSGHATLAFATAAALDHETRSPWVPWIAYPLAAVVGWSRVRDQEHWTSDVLAGAAIGVWTVDKAERFMRRPTPDRPVGWMIDPRPGNWRAELAFRF